MKKTIITILTIFSFVFVNAQSPLQKRMDYSVYQVQIKDALRQLSLESKVSIAFSSNFFDREILVSVNVKNETIDNILTQIFQNANVNYKVVGDQIVITAAPPKEKRKFTLSGFIEDNETGERLIAVTIFSPKFNEGTTTNEYGFYSLTLPEGETEIIYKYVGCEAILEKIKLTKDVEKNMDLNVSLTLSEVIVLSNNQISSIESLQNDNYESIEKISEMPMLGRGGDLVKQINFLPGVETGAEGLGGFYVRGGNVDQNLTLMDGVSIYNPSHFLGLFSVFSSEAIKNSKLYKGDAPARYGGRISSVLDVRTKEGNKKNYSGEVSPGFLSSRVTVEGPILKNKLAFFTTFRLSELGIITRVISKAVRTGNESGAEIPQLKFYDSNIKLHYEFSKKDKLFFSIYAGQDIFKMQNEFGSVEDSLSMPPFTTSDSSFQDQKLNWGNNVMALRWNHLFNNQLFSNTTLTFSRFNFNFAAVKSREEKTNDTTDFFEYDFVEYENFITDLGIKVDFDFIPSPKHYIRFGSAMEINSYGSGNTDTSVVVNNLADFEFPDLSELAASNFLENENFSINFSGYLEDEIRFSERLKANLGLRMTLFGNDNNRWYSAFEPRLHANYLLSKRWSINASITRNFQAIHLLTSTGLGLPVDVWVPSLEDVKPQKSWQQSIALQYSNPQSFRLRVEAFNKKMENLIFLKESIFQFNNLSISDSTFIIGKGSSYGMEVTLEKEFRSLFLFGYYTLSKSNRKFKDFNLGKSFPFQYDRRHSLKLGMLWNATKKMDIGFTWTYWTGTPRIYSEIFENFIEDLPDAQTFFPPGEYNQKRSIPYHRLDAKINWTKVKSYGTHIFGFSVYNMYIRLNPTFYERVTIYDSNNNPIGIKEEPLSIAPIIPSFNYSFQF